MDIVGITVNYGRYQATVHYLTCGLWTGYHTHLNRVMPPSIKMKMCVVCKPTAADVVTIAHDIKWLEKYGDAMTLCTRKTVYEENGEMERLAVDQRLHGGKRLGKSRPEA